MAKKRKAVSKRVTRKPARKRRASSPDATVNTLVILVVIVTVLGGLFLYAQNKRQAALLPGLIHAIAMLPAPSATSLPATPAAESQAIQPSAGPEHSSSQ